MGTFAVDSLILCLQVKNWLIVLACFLHVILRKTMIKFFPILRMNESNSIELIDKTDLSEQTKFWLDEISKIENYFHEEINQRKSCSKKRSRYLAAFDYIDMILIVLSATTGGVPICLFTSVVGASVGIASASCTLIFSLRTGIVKKY